LDYRRESITGVILAGGKAERMDGHDKGLIPLAGRPMIEYVIDAMFPQVGELVINANRNAGLYGRYRLPVISDLTTNFAGPLAGIAAALDYTTSDLVLAGPCDGPWLPKDLGERLYGKMLDEDADVCVAHDGNRMQPVFGLFHRKLMPNLQAFLASGDRKLQLWLKSQRLATADFSDFPDAFVNVNTPGERKRVEGLLLNYRESFSRN
jgi:molybdopterin-guanine dinucleotide biosynthesis protein A